jgi:thioesterase domain-containing protein
LVPIQPAGSHPPFYCVHGLGGHVLRFRQLAKALGPNRPFYGLQAWGLDGEHQCDTRVEDMAAHYLTEIRQVQPHGPYFLGGYSFGGAVAYEMARQLQAEGERVAFLALLDAYPDDLTPRGTLLAAFLRLHRREKIAYLARTKRILAKKLHRKIIAMQFPQTLKNVHRACSLAEKSYRWPPYSGPVCLFRATERGLWGRNPLPTEMVVTPGTHWEIHDVTGDHGSIIREPRVDDLAEQMKTCMQAAYSEGQASPRIDEAPSAGISIT